MICGVRTLRLFAPLAFAFAALAVAGCGGSNGTSPNAAPSPSSVTSTTALPAAGGTIPFPPANGLTGSFLIGPNAPAGDILTTTSSAVAPANALTISSALRKAAATNRSTLAVANLPFLFVTAQVSVVTPVALFLQESVTLTSQPVIEPFYVEIDDLTAQSALITIAGTIANGVVTYVNAGTGGAPAGTLDPTHSYLFQFYYVTGATPPPTAGPTMTPTPSGSSSPTGTPTPNGPLPASTTISVQLTGAAQTIAMPALSNANGFVATLNLGPNTAAGATLTATGYTAGLPPGLSASLPTEVMPPGMAMPFYTLAVQSSATISSTCSGASCPANPVTLSWQSFSTTALSIFGAGCQLSPCPIGASDTLLLPSSNNAVALSQGAFPDLPPISSTTNFYVFYTLSANAVTASATFSVPSSKAAALTIPTVNGINAVAQVGGFSVGGVLTATANSMLPASITTPPAGDAPGNTFYALSITTTPSIVFSPAGLPIVVTLPPALAATLGSVPLMAGECTGATCNPGDVVPLTLTNGNTLTIQPSTFTDITGFNGTPITIVFFHT